MGDEDRLGQTPSGGGTDVGPGCEGVSYGFSRTFSLKDAKGTRTADLGSEGRCASFLLVSLWPKAYFASAHPWITYCQCQLDGTHSISRKRPLASVPVRRSSTVPPGFTLRNHRSFCLAPSGSSEVIGYAEVICQSWTESDTSSYAFSLCRALGSPNPEPAYASLFRKDHVDLRSDGARSEEQSGGVFVVHRIWVRVSIAASTRSEDLNLHLVRTSFGPNCRPVKVCLKVLACGDEPFGRDEPEPDWLTSILRVPRYSALSAGRHLALVGEADLPQVALWLDLYLVSWSCAIARRRPAHPDTDAASATVLPAVVSQESDWSADDNLADTDQLRSQASEITAYVPLEQAGLSSRLPLARLSEQVDPPLLLLRPAHH